MRSKLNLRGMRSVNVMIAAVMLAVPASAFALGTTTSTIASATTPQTTALPMRVSPRRVAFGDRVRVAGVAAAGSTVMLEADYGRAGVWQRIASTAAGPRGGFAFRPRLRHSGLLRAVLAPTATTAPATAGPRAGTETPQRVTPVQVAAQLRTVRPSRNVLAGQPVRVLGRLLPGSSGQTVRLQAHSSSGWRTVTRTRTGRSGGFALRFAPSQTMIGRRLRVLFAGNRVNGASTVPAGALTVYEATVASWYDDAGTTGCGFHAEYGVANKSLPCGTQVHFRYGGRSVTATVDDRGPYVGGRDFDLNQNTAAALGFAGVGTVWVAG